ncbi:hypothetical protein PG987_004956 [Apiospora arundinis]
MQGLRDLVNHHGGREVLASEPLILHKIYRADLFGCLDTGQRSWFDGPSTLQLSAQPIAPAHSDGFKALFKTRWCARPVAKPTPVQAKHVRDALTEVQYALVSDEVMGYCKQQTYTGRFNNFFRITLIMYSLTLLHEPTPSYTLGRQIGLVFSRAYSDVMHSPIGEKPDFDGRIAKDFRLWVLFLAATVMDGTECDISRRFRAMFAQLVMVDDENIISSGYTEVRSRLQRYLWVSCIHDASFERIWEDTFRVTDIGNFDATSA